eukprot:jgi/Tetstr1/464051/TSEL_008856.t1
MPRPSRLARLPPRRLDPDHDREAWEAACRHAPLASTPVDDWCVIVPSSVAKAGCAVIYRGRRMHPYQLFRKDFGARARVYSSAKGARVPLRTLFQYVNAGTLSSPRIHVRDRVMRGERQVGVVATFDRVGLPAAE